MVVREKEVVLLLVLCRFQARVTSVSAARRGGNEKRADRELTLVTSERRVRKTEYGTAGGGGNRRGVLLLELGPGAGRWDEAV